MVDKLAQYTRAILKRVDEKATSRCSNIETIGLDCHSFGPLFQSSHKRGRRLKGPHFIFTDSRLERLMSGHGSNNQDEQAQVARQRDALVGFRAGDAMVRGEASEVCVAHSWWHGSAALPHSDPGA